MLKKIYFKFGSSPGQPTLEFEPGSMTVFVGSNNSGKSLTLREIETFMEKGKDSEYKIIVNCDLEVPEDPEYIEKVIMGRCDEEKSKNHSSVTFINTNKLHSDNRQYSSFQFTKNNINEVISKITSSAANSSFYWNFASLLTVRLDGRTRFSLTEPRPSDDLQKSPTNHLTALFKDDVVREKIRDIIYDAFGLYFVIDLTGVKKVRIRMSERKPKDATEERGLDDKAIEFHSQAIDIADMSDGIKAFTGLIAAVMSTDYKIMLIDEPEAFLHPPLARKLGKTLTELASERDANILTATHSSDFLMGCIQSGEKVNIVRLTYQKNIPTARLLKPDKIQEMMRDPLLRSTGVLSALFHGSAIVGEGDSDRAFYQEINERLLAKNKERGINECIFLNAQNWQTIHRIIHPLREIGILAVAIVDLDVIKADTKPWSSLLKSAFVPEELIDSWGVLRGKVKEAFNKLVKPYNLVTNEKKEQENYKEKEQENYKEKEQKYYNEEIKKLIKGGGITNLNQPGRETAENLLNGLSEYGIFVVPNGEVERWLSHLGVKANNSKEKQEWLIKIFEKMGTDPNDSSYVHPQEGDVWNFMKKIGDWIADPERKGMPK